MTILLQRSFQINKALDTWMSNCLLLKLCDLYTNAPRSVAHLFMISVAYRVTCVNIRGCYNDTRQDHIVPRSDIVTLLVT